MPCARSVLVVDMRIEGEWQIAVGRLARFAGREPPRLADAAVNGEVQTADPFDEVNHDDEEYKTEEGNYDEHVENDA